MAGSPTGIAWVTTPHEAGAVAIIHVAGNASLIMDQLVKGARWQPGALRLASIGDVEDVLCALIDEQTAIVMPPGGQRVVQLLTTAISRCGLRICDTGTLDPQIVFPEAQSRVDALGLWALWRAASPLAIDLLMRQTTRLEDLKSVTEEDRARSRRLNRLIDPPLVVVAGAPNAGKSTLSNVLSGRSVSIAADLPGTTRDYTATKIEFRGVVVNWVDTPGIRAADDPVERQSVAIARRLMGRADLLVAIADVDSDWPQLPREPDLRIASKCDLESRSDADIAVSAITGKGIHSLAQLVRERIVPQRDLDHPGPWLFDRRLEA